MRSVFGAYYKENLKLDEPLSNLDSMEAMRISESQLFSAPTGIIRYGPTHISYSYRNLLQNFSFRHITASKVVS